MQQEKKAPLTKKKENIQKIVFRLPFFQFFFRFFLFNGLLRLLARNINQRCHIGNILSFGKISLNADKKTTTTKNKTKLKTPNICIRFLIFKTP